MAKAKITIVYRQLLDASSTGDFAKKLLLFSYAEFKLKSQAYNTERQFDRFSQMKSADGRANSLHYKCGFAISGLVDGLQRIIPGCTGTFGEPVNFETYRFELIESSLQDPQLHQVAIYYTSPLLLLYEVMADTLLLSTPANQNEMPAETFLLQLSPELSISSYRPLTAQNLAGHAV